MTLTTVLGLVAIALVPQQPPSGKTGSILVIHSRAFTPDLVTVELFQDGKQIRGRELKRFVGTTEPTKENSVLWDKLAPGKYELHFLAPGMATFVKKVFISEDDPSNRVEVEISDKPTVVGGSISLAELADSVEKLKKDNAELKAKLEALAAEVEKLRKK